MTGDAKPNRPDGAAAASAGRPLAGRSLKHLTPSQRALLELRLAKQKATLQSRPEPITRSPTDAEPQLSSTQERLWLLQRLTGNPGLYNVHRALRIRGDLDHNALRLAIRAVIERHEILRTSYSESHGIPSQQIHPTTDLPDAENLLVVSDYSRSKEPIAALLEREIVKGFDLTAIPALRATLFTMSTDDHLLLLVLPHIACDGWSMEILLRDLAMLCGAHICGKPANLPELTIQFADYAAWERRRQASGEWDNQLNYWRQQLANQTMLALPADRVRTGRPSFRGDSIDFKVPAELVNKTRSLGQTYGASLFMTTLAAFDVLLYRSSGQTDLSVGTPIAGRQRSEVEPLIGCFLNTLVLRSDLSARPTFIELLKQVRTTTLDAFSNQDVPFERVVETLNPNRDSGINPLFNVMFALNNQPSPNQSVAGLRFDNVGTRTHTAKFDLTLMLTESERGIDATLEFDSELFDTATATRLATHFVELLRFLTTNAHAPIDIAVDGLPAVAQISSQGGKMLPTIVSTNHAAPGVSNRPDSVQGGLIRIWQRVLGIDTVGLDDNFFELGGHSLLGTQMLVTIEKRFGVHLPFAVLFEKATIRGLAEIVRDGGWSTEWQSLAAIQTKGNKPPFFCIHGDPSKLGPHLDPDQPYYWLHRGQDGRLLRNASVEEVAQDHLKEILAVQPQGPYYLGGYSFGGLLALEVAKVLKARGESVVMLALFDPAAPPLPRSEFPKRARKEQLRTLPVALLRAALWLPLEIRRQVRRLVLRVAEQIHLMLGNPLPNRLRFARHGRLYSRAAGNYRYGTYDGYTLLFAPRVDARDLEIMTRRWRRVIPNDLEVHSVWTATRHGDLFEEPSMTYVARQINRILSNKGLRQSKPTVEPPEQSVGAQARPLSEPLMSTRLENTG